MTPSITWRNMPCKQDMIQRAHFVLVIRAKKEGDQRDKRRKLDEGIEKKIFVLVFRICLARLHNSATTSIVVTIHFPKAQPKGYWRTRPNQLSVMHLGYSYKSWLRSSNPPTHGILQSLLSLLLKPLSRKIFYYYFFAFYMKNWYHCPLNCFSKIYIN